MIGVGNLPPPLSVSFPFHHWICRLCASRYIYFSYISLKVPWSLNEWEIHRVWPVDGCTCAFSGWPCWRDLLVSAGATWKGRRHNYRFMFTGRQYPGDINKMWGHQHLEKYQLTKANYFWFIRNKLCPTNLGMKKSSKNETVGFHFERLEEKPQHWCYV